MRILHSCFVLYLQLKNTQTARKTVSAPPPFRRRARSLFPQAHGLCSGRVPWGTGFRDGWPLGPPVSHLCNGNFDFWALGPCGALGARSSDPWVPFLENEVAFFFQVSQLFRFEIKKEFFSPPSKNTTL